jgi:hypothetical protein
LIYHAPHLLFFAGVAYCKFAHTIETGLHPLRLVLRLHAHTNNSMALPTMQITSMGAIPDFSVKSAMRYLTFTTKFHQK